MAETDPPATIKIGVISSLDPIGGVWSNSANIGLRRAAEEINQSGGINGKKVELVFEDDRFEPKNAITAYHKLTKIDKVKIIFGPQFEQTLTPIIPLAARDGTLIITTIASTPNSKSKYPWVVHSVPPDKQAAKCLADTINSDQRSKTLFLIPEESYSQTFAKHVQKNLNQKTPKIVNYISKGVDYNALLLKVKKYKPDSLVFFFVTADAAIEAYRKLKALNIDLPIYSNEVIHTSDNFFKEVGEIAKGTTYCIVPWSTKDHKIAAFLDTLDEKAELPFYTLIAYDTLRWLSLIMRTHGENTKEIKDAIFELDYPGIFTRYSFDQYGDLTYLDFAAHEIYEKGRRKRKINKDNSTESNKVLSFYKLF